jgi:hypothetical protein
MHDDDMQPDINIETLSETENYTVWRADEPDHESTYHVEIGPVTAHFFEEEWQNFVQLIRDSAAEFAETGGDQEDVEVELDWGTMIFNPDEWQEFANLMRQV